MALDLDKLGAEQERLVKQQDGWVQKAQDMADRMRDFADPPYLREMREAEQRMRDFIDPPVLRRWREEYKRTERLAADAFAHIQPLIDSNMFTADLAKNFAAQHLLDMPVDYLAGLKEIMSSERLSTSIAKSLMVHDSEIEALRRSAALFETVKIPDYERSPSALRDVHRGRGDDGERSDSSRLR